MADFEPHFTVIHRKQTLTAREYRLSSEERLAEELGLKLRHISNGVQFYRDRENGRKDVVQIDDVNELDEVAKRVVTVWHDVMWKGILMDRSGTKMSMVPTDLPAYARRALLSIAPPVKIYRRFVAVGMIANADGEVHEYSCGADLTTAASGLIRPASAYDGFAAFACESGLEFTRDAMNLDESGKAFCEVVAGCLDLRRCEPKKVANIGMTIEL